MLYQVLLYVLDMNFPEIISELIVQVCSSAVSVIVQICLGISFKNIHFQIVLLLNFTVSYSLSSITVFSRFRHTCFICRSGTSVAAKGGSQRLVSAGMSSNKVSALSFYSTIGDHQHTEWYKKNSKQSVLMWCKQDFMGSKTSYICRTSISLRYLKIKSQTLRYKKNSDFKK